MLFLWQQAMEASNAKYKIYLHQDVFVINPRLINNLLEIFQADSKVGMIGVAGTVKLLHEHPVWWDSPLTSLFGTCYTRLSESVFHGWHFYDISQSREFINAGYKVVIPYQQEPWVIHDCGCKPLDNSYYENMRIFKENYNW